MGFVGQSLWGTLPMMGITGHEKKSDNYSSREGGRTRVTVDMEEDGEEFEDKIVWTS